MGHPPRYAPLIWSICRWHGLGSADAEDVAQAVRLHLVRSYGACDGTPADMRVWATAAASPGYLAVVLLLPLRSSSSPPPVIAAVMASRDVTA